MNIFELIVLGLALSMDSFAAAVSKGIEVTNLNIKKMLIISIWFAIFQAMMPLIGYFLANILKGWLLSVDHWISFFVLLYLGTNMIKEAKEDAASDCDSLAFRAMLVISIAISIDAFTVGITYSFLNVDIFLATLITFLATFITTMLGTKIGNIFGNILNEKALVLGGLVLISLGIKILLEHLEILP